MTSGSATVRELHTEDRSAVGGGRRRRGRNNAAASAPRPGDVVVVDDKHRIVLRTSREKINAALDRAAARPNER